MKGPKRSSQLRADFGPDIEDDECLRLIAVGNSKAFEELYRRHAPAVFKFVAKTAGDSGLAQEVVQDTFLAVWKNVRFDGQSSVRTWLFSIARRQLRDRTRRQRFQFLHSHPEIPSSADAPEDLAVSTAAARDLSAAIDRLTAIQREVLYLLVIENLTLRDTSIVLQIPIGTVKSRLNAARSSLEQRWRIPITVERENAES